MNKANSFIYSFFGLLIFQVSMSMEEILRGFPGYLLTLTGKVHNKIPFFPVISISDQTLIFFSLFLIVVFIFIGIAIFLDSSWSKIFAVILGGIEIINGGLHILTSLYFMRYIPGSISAIGLIIFGFLVIYIRPSIQREATEEEK